MVMTDDLTIKTLLEETDALRKGHYLLSSGLHSDTYVQCAKILQYPRYARYLGKELSELWHGTYIDLVVSPALGGLLIGYATAEALECRMVFTERANGQMELRRGLSIEPDDSVLIVEDVVTTGGSAKETVKLVKSLGADVVGVASIIDRSAEDDSSFELRSLLKIDIPSYPKDDCPLCAEGVEVESPGSKYLNKSSI